ncbi:Rv3654c family TadE-like protein [Micrococcus sp.]|uniref:Rv3654c family TadE-like protein n=1 Tax=Micrococcus sp. TaxID=1271 RepID=UPI002A9102B6|nr:Rv3654c family TadE-like protein [Micrococcus sp.]MDY6055300.1 Rv3654c family TadE-like protein [Micrococcus sp.]
MPRTGACLAEETGAGGVTALGTAAAGAVLVVAVAAVGQAAVTDARAAGAADLAALAASDARRGLSSHDPCTLAEQTARANGASLVDCRAGADGSLTVAVQADRAPLPPVRAVAVAGAPVPDPPLRPDVRPAPAPAPPSLSPTGSR